MNDKAQEYDVTKDIEFYLKIRDIAHKLLIDFEIENINDEKELKKAKLLLDLGDKAIQNRLKLLIQVGKVDIDMDEEGDIETLSELLIK